MIRIKPIAEVQLDHRAYYFHHAAGFVVAASRDGCISLFTANAYGKPFARFNLRRELSGISFSGDTQTLAATTETEIVLINVANQKPTKKWPGRFEACLFRDADSMWVVERQDDHTLMVEVRSFPSGNTIAHTRLEDIFCDSDVWLQASQGIEGVAIWLAAGQHGQHLFWANENRGTFEIEDTDIHNSGMPSFHANRNEFLVVGNEDLRKYSFPDFVELDALTWPTESGDTIGYYAHYLSNQYAAWSSMEGRLFLVDLAEMQFCEEIDIIRHEPHWLPELYLRNEQRIGSDLQMFEPLALGSLASIHQPLPSKSSTSKWKNRFLCRLLASDPLTWKDRVLFWNWNDCLASNGA